VRATRAKRSRRKPTSRTLPTTGLECTCTASQPSTGRARGGALGCGIYVEHHTRQPVVHADGPPAGVAPLGEPQPRRHIARQPEANRVLAKERRSAHRMPSQHSQRRDGPTQGASLHHGERRQSTPRSRSSRSTSSASRARGTKKTHDLSVEPTLGSTIQPRHGEKSDGAFPYSDKQEEEKTHPWSGASVTIHPRFGNAARCSCAL